MRFSENIRWFKQFNCHVRITMSQHNHKHHHSSASEHGYSQSYNKTFAFTTTLNLLFVGVEFSYGFITNSTSLMADAGHNLSDVLGLFLAWGASILALRPAKERFTYGYRSSSILAALLNAVFLLIACGAIAWESVTRFYETPSIPGITVSIVAGVGIVVNGLSAFLFARGSKSDLNIRGGYLHMLADTAVSAGVVFAGFLMNYTQWYWLDPALSLLIVLIIIVSTWGLLRESIELALSAVPSHIDIKSVDEYLRNILGVTQVRDLHIWGMSTTESALTVHLVMPDGYPGDSFIQEVTERLTHKFKIAHVTIQIQQGSVIKACSPTG